MNSTLGEYRVGVTFNPSNDADVKIIKRLSAELIDFINGVAVDGGPEVQRLKALAMTRIEEGAMWGVKAATKGPRDV